MKIFKKITLIILMSIVVFIGITATIKNRMDILMLAFLGAFCCGMTFLYDSQD